MAPVVAVQHDPPGLAGADAVRLHRVGIEAAVAAGARRILYTSHQGTGLDSPFKPARDHAATEAIPAGSGVAWTSLRNGFYAHALDWLLGSWRETGIIAAPADGPVSLLGTFLAAREGRFAGVDPLLGDLLGRRPRTMRDLLAERVAA